MLEAVAKHIPGRRTLLCSLALLSLFVSTPGRAQHSAIELPNRKELFLEDERLAQKQLSKSRSAVMAEEKSASPAMKFEAPEVHYDQEHNQIIGSGGVVISRSGVQAQADAATANTETQDASLQGNVLVTVKEASISAESSDFNLESEEGAFKNADFFYENGAYEIKAGQMLKLSEERYRLFDCSFSTCHCEDRSQPWAVSANDASITQEGYAHTYGTTLDVYNVPVFYIPYLAFPAKQERASGLLAPGIGYSDRDGVQYKQPIFMVIDDSSDLMLTPFTEVKTRTGASLGYEQVFSRNNSLESRFYYSDESARGESLRGAIPLNPSLVERGFQDSNRTGGFYRHSWRTERSADIPAAFIADTRYVSDDLFPREIDDEDIADKTAPYLTSVATLRASPFDFLLAEVGGEYNQDMTTNDRLTLQRLPEATISELYSFHPFGYNPFGLKLVTQAGMTQTNFERREGFDGWRFRTAPQARIPFHVKNYFQGQAAVAYDFADYNLRDTEVPVNGVVDDLSPRLPDSSDRGVPIYDYQLRTDLERVFEVERDSILDTLTGLGAENQSSRLVRLKHTIEPFMTYRYIPDIDQSDIPVFDTDRIVAKRLLMYGFTTSLFGRFKPRRGAVEDITELTPRIEELPVPNVEQFPEGEGAGRVFTGDVAINTGDIRELSAITVRQGYDFLADEPEFAETHPRDFTDLLVNWALYPNNYFSVRVDSNIKADGSGFSQWGLTSQLRDDRGDALRARYSFTDNAINQVEGNLEVALLERLKLGFYSRYDDREGEFIDQDIALRLISSCNCWHLDLGFSEKVNPDKQALTLRFTFVGLGDITQDIRYSTQDTVAGAPQ